MRESEEKTETIHSYQQRGHTACFQLSVCLLVFFHTFNRKMCYSHNSPPYRIYSDLLRATQPDVVAVVVISSLSLFVLPLPLL